MMTTQNQTIQEIIDSDYMTYAMYVLENRAIPSCIDGFKPVSRKVLYSMMTDHNGKKTKISDLGGISKCLSGDTNVTVNGNSVTLKDYYETWSQNDMVSSFDERTNQYVEAQVQNVIMNPAMKEIFEIELDNGEILRLTEDHPVMTSSGWKLVKELNENDDILKVQKN